METKHRISRLADFKWRADNSPGDTYYHLSKGWPYIPVHHFADETGDRVWKVDCWCLPGADAALLECVISNESSREPGFYARIDATRPFWPKLHAVLREPLTRAVVEEAMRRFVELGFPDPLLSKLAPGGPLVRLTP